MSAIKILLIEPNQILSEGITTLIEKQNNIDLVAVSDGNPYTLPNPDQIETDVVLMDMELDVHDRQKVITRVKNGFEDVKIIGTSLAPEAQNILQFIQAGAQGFIIKTGAPNEMVTTICKVHQGETVLPHTMTHSLFSQVSGSSFTEGNKIVKADTRITDREKEIVFLLEKGMSNKQIGATLCISPFTVKSHVHNIMEKLELDSRLQIANYFHSQTYHYA